MENKKKINWKSVIISSILTLIFSAVLFLVFYLVMLSFNGAAAKLKCAVDASLDTGIIILCLTGLVWVSRLGAFDTFAYGFSQLGTSVFGKQPNKYKSLVEYKEAKNEKRSQKNPNYLVYLIAASLFVVAYFILSLIFHAKYF